MGVASPLPGAGALYSLRPGARDLARESPLGAVPKPWQQWQRSAFAWVRSPVWLPADSAQRVCVASPVAVSVRWAAESAKRRRDDPQPCWRDLLAPKSDLSPAVASLDWPVT